MVKKHGLMISLLFSTSFASVMPERSDELQFSATQSRRHVSFELPLITKVPSDLRRSPEHFFPEDQEESLSLLSSDNRCFEIKNPSLFPGLERKQDGCGIVHCEFSSVQIRNFLDTDWSSFDIRSCSPQELIPLLQIGLFLEADILAHVFSVDSHQSGFFFRDLRLTNPQKIFLEEHYPIILEKIRSLIGAPFRGSVSYIKDLVIKNENNLGAILTSISHLESLSLQGIFKSETLQSLALSLPAFSNTLRELSIECTFGDIDASSFLAEIMKLNCLRYLKFIGNFSGITAQRLFAEVPKTIEKLHIVGNLGYLVVDCEEIKKFTKLIELKIGANLSEKNVDEIMACMSQLPVMHLEIETDEIQSVLQNAPLSLDLLFVNGFQYTLVDDVWRLMER